MFVPVWMLVLAGIAFAWLLWRRRFERRHAEAVLQQIETKAFDAFERALEKRNAGDMEGALDVMGSFLGEVHGVHSYSLRDRREAASYFESARINAS